MKEIDRLLEEVEKMPLDKNTRETVNAVSDDVLMGEYGKALESVNKFLARNGADIFKNQYFETASSRSTGEKP
jgi:hypothetical protein